MGRSHDANILKPCYIVIDVGGEYNHSELKYDPHQTPYDEKFVYSHEGECCTNLSASGLTCKHYGMEVM